MRSRRALISPLPRPPFVGKVNQETTHWPCRAHNLEVGGSRPVTYGWPLPVQISRLLHAHEIVLKEARTMAQQAVRDGDDGTNDVLVSNVIRTNEAQVWFIAEHLVGEPLVSADESHGEARQGNQRNRRG
jgi:hypothetical protein